jgi:hypothetical protein
MRANTKVLVGLGLVGGLALVLFPKSKAAAAPGSGTVSTGAGGGLLTGIVAGAKKIFSGVSKVLGGAAAAASAGIGVTALTAGGSVAGGTVAAIGSGAGALTDFAAVSEPVFGSVTGEVGPAAIGSGGGVGAVLGPIAMLSIPVIFGPPLVSLLTGNKNLADMEAEAAAAQKQYLEDQATLKREQEIAAAASLSHKALAILDVQAADFSLSAGQ